MQLKYDGYHKIPSVCEIDIYKGIKYDERALVICKESPDNTGTSITNRAEVIAEKVCKMFDIDPFRLTWIEHYPARPNSRGRFRNDDGEVVDLVTFHVTRKGMSLSLSEPKWQRSSWEEVDEIRRQMRKIA